MATVFNDEIVFSKGVTFDQPITYAEDPPVLSLDNVANLGISGDMTVGDDLIVTDDATIGGDLAVTGGITGAGTVQGADLVATDDLTVGDDASIGGDLAVTGALSAGSLTVGSSVSIGAINTTVDNTLRVTSALNATGASIVGLHEHVTLDVASLVGAGAAVYGFPSPVAGTIVKIQSRLKAALTTGNATVTARIGATSVTNGALTITQSGSAAGDIDSCDPSGQNTVSVGSNVNVLVGGTNDAAVGATLVFTFLRSA